MQYTDELVAISSLKTAINLTQAATICSYSHDGFTKGKTSLIQHHLSANYISN